MEDSNIREITDKNDNVFRISVDELEKMAFEETQKMRKIFFNICPEDYFPDLVAEKEKIRGKPYAIIPEPKWEKYREELSELLGSFLVIREVLDTVMPVYEEYFEEYQKKHDVSLEDYISWVGASYDADEFERVREEYDDLRFDELSKFDEEDPEI